MQVAIVTGASSGIGFGCATKLAEMGMAVLGAGRDEDRLADLEKAIGDPDRVATHRRRPDRRRRARTHRGPRRAAVGPHRLPDQQRRRRQPQAAARNRRRLPGLFPRFDAAGAVPAGARRDTAHAAGLGDHQRHVDVRGRRRSAWRRLLGGQGRPDLADHCTSPASTARRESVATQWRRASRSPRWSRSGSRTSGSARSTPR